jgi:cyclophilin family peptidyl-prolyl cis-trans isomerase
MKHLLLWLLAAAILAGCAPAKKDPPAPSGQAEVRGQPKRLQWSEPPAMQIDPNKTYFATLKTSMGDVRIELFAKDAPLTVNNFVFLARHGYYDNVLFHRIVRGFMVQTGDPTGTGTGSPGYRFKDELPPQHSYQPGIVAMANSGPNTNGSQFFICNGPQCSASLDSRPHYTQFGRVVAGMDIVEKISAVPVTEQRGERSKPLQEVWIKTVVIEEK